jgi:integrase
MSKRAADRDGLYRVPNSPYWRCSFVDATGKRIRRSTGETDKVKAKLILADWVSRDGKKQEAPRTILRSFEELMLAYLDNGRTLKGRLRSSRTLERDEGCIAALNQQFGAYLLQMDGVAEDAYPGEVLNGAAVLVYVEKRRLANVGDSAIRRELAVLGAAITGANAQLHWGIVDPTRHRKPPQSEGRLRWITIDEADRLIIAAGQEPRSPYLADWITVALHTGCRKGELLGLTWDRVDLHRGVIYLEAEHNKSRQRQSVPLNSIAKTALNRRAAFRAEYCPETAWVFCEKSGTPIQSIRKGFQTACRRADIQDFRPHDCRHTCASWLVQQGVPLSTVKEVLRHSSITVTERYAHLAPENARSAVSVLEGLGASSHTSSHPDEQD